MREDGKRNRHLEGRQGDVCAGKCQDTRQGNEKQDEMSLYSLSQKNRQT